MAYARLEEFTRDLAKALGKDPVPDDLEMPPPGKLDLSHLKPGMVEASVSLLGGRSQERVEPQTVTPEYEARVKEETRQDMMYTHGEDWVNKYFQGTWEREKDLLL